MSLPHCLTLSLAQLSHSHSELLPSLLLSQAEEVFTETERTYTEINNELHEMLPNFYQGYACERQTEKETVRWTERKRETVRQCARDKEMDRERDSKTVSERLERKRSLLTCRSVSFYSSILQTMFSENANFHKGCEKVTNLS